MKFDKFSFVINRSAVRFRATAVVESMSYELKIKFSNHRGTLWGTLGGMGTSLKQITSNSNVSESL